MTQLQIDTNGALPIELEATIGEKIAILGIAGSGKALALDTPLPTPTGWTTMGDVAVGDWLLDEEGNPCQVSFATGIQLNRTCYEVVFSDHSSIIADAEHLWLSHGQKSRNSDQQQIQKARRLKGKGYFREKRRVNFPKLVTTEQMKDTLFITYNNTVKRNHVIPCTKPLCLPDADLPIAPYVLGAWLGDGATAAGNITTADNEVLEAIRSEGYFVAGAYKGSESGKAAVYRIGEDRNRVLFARTLRLEGLRGNKHIPLAYLRASYSQRLALLQGLMDTDGTIARGSNSCVFSSTKECLAQGVAELVVSMGWTAYRRSRPAKLYGVQHGTAYEVRFRPTVNVFRLPRKGNGFNFNSKQISRHVNRRVAAINPVPSVPVKCIQVDSPSHLYLAGRDMIPTHNTNSSAVILEELLSNNLPMTVVDIEGEYWGLKERHDLVIIGKSANVDLEVDASNAAHFATYSVEQGISMILDLADYDTLEDMHDFLIAYFEALWVAVSKARRPYFVVLEEAHEFIPQGANTPIKKLLTTFALRGRKRGVGMIIISQRSAKVEKSVLTQASFVFLHKVVHPTDLKVYQDILPLPARIVEERVGALAKGDALVLVNHKVHTAHIRRRHTYHAGATPELDATQRTHLRRADDNLLAELQRLVTAAPEVASNGDGGKSPKDAGDGERMRAQLSAKEGTITAQKNEIARLQQQVEKLGAEIERWKQASKRTPSPVATQPGKRPAVLPPPPPPPARHVVERSEQAQQRLQRRWEAMLRDLRQKQRHNRDILVFLLEREGTAYTVKQLAKGLVLNESTITKNPPLDIVEMGLIKRSGTPGKFLYTASARATLTEMFEGMDIEKLIGEMIKRLKN